MNIPTYKRRLLSVVNKFVRYLSNPPSAKKEISRFLISTEEAKAMHKNYINNQLKTLNKAAKRFDETESAWLPYNVLLQYLAYVKATYLEEGNVDVSGFRFYFSAYEEGQDDLYSGGDRRMTITIMPTRKLKNNQIGDGHTSEQRERHGHLNHVSVFLEGEDEKKVTNYFLFRRGMKNVDTALVMPPFPPPPQNG